MKKKILVIGSMNTDMVVKTPRIPHTGETILGGIFSRFEGGKGANQAIAAKMLFPDTSFCAGVGDDSMGADYLRYLKRRRVDVSLVKKFKDAHSGVALITVDRRGENAITVAPGANLLLSPKDMAKINFSQFSHVAFQLETDLDTVCEGLERAKAAGCETILTPAPAVILPRTMLRNVDYIIPNEHEIMLVQKGYSNAADAARALLKKGVKHVIITQGSKGSLLIDWDGEKRFPAHKVQAVDTVGAGDCFTGSFMAGLRIYGDIEKAIKLATAAAALAVCHMGAQSYRPKREVLAFMRKNENLTV